MFASPLRSLETDVSTKILYLKLKKLIYVRNDRLNEIEQFQHDMTVYFSPGCRGQIQSGQRQAVDRIHHIRVLNTIKIESFITRVENISLMHIMWYNAK